MADEDALLRGPRTCRDYVGRTVANKYAIVRLIGEGGMGAVYEARHLVIGRRFAVKFLRPDMVESASAVARFKREAEAAGGLENEHVVAMVDAGMTDDGAPYLVMEYLQGESVRALLKRCGPLPVAQAVQLALQVCQGLQSAHSLGMVHRDLKPENLFVVRGEGERPDLVKILDFGIVKVRADHPPTTHSGVSAITVSGQLVGTPHYMSPEQARGDTEIDGRADIYSLGVLLYELLCGLRPHPGDNFTAVVFHLLKQAPIRVEALRPGLPAGLADVVHRAFAFEASDRFPDVASLSAALSPYATRPDSGEAAAAAPPRVLTGSEPTMSNAEIPVARVPQGRAAATAGRFRDPRAWRVGLTGLAVTLVALGAVRFGRTPVVLAPKNEAALLSPPATLGSRATGLSGGAIVHVGSGQGEAPSIPPRTEVDRTAADASPPVAAPAGGTSTPSLAATRRPTRDVPSPVRDAERSAARALRERLYEP